MPRTPQSEPRRRDDPRPDRPWLTYLPVLVLGLVAVRHFLLVQTADLTPWLGGGFGMFASVDRIDHRVTRAYLLTPEGDVLVALDRLDGMPRMTARGRLVAPSDRRPGYEELNALRRAEMKARGMPTRERTDELAALIARLRWHRVGETARWLPSREDDVGPPGHRADDGTSGAPLEVEGVRVEVWRVQMETHPTAASAARLAAWTWRPSRG